MNCTKIVIGTKTQKYPIFIGKSLIPKMRFLLNKNLKNFEKCLVIVDKNVPKKILKKIIKILNKKQLSIFQLKANELNKSQKSLESIIKILLKENFSRQDCLITLGGGITGDLGGFAASVFKRGIQLVNMPTTLLAQVDSCIGGKTGINTKYGKNLVGSFYQPKLVISDTELLESLPRREIICGYAEILKHSLIADKNFFNFLQKNISQILNLKAPFLEKAIIKSCKIKKLIVEKDEKESGIRKILNLGHTFAHAYEASLGYSKILNHGEAVILGIKSASKFSLKSKILKITDYQSIISHLNNANLSHDIKIFFSLKDIDKIISFMLTDKKNVSKSINLILLRKIGLTQYNKNFSKNKIKLFLKNELTN